MGGWEVNSAIAVHCAKVAIRQAVMSQRAPGRRQIVQLASSAPFLDGLAPNHQALQAHPTQAEPAALGALRLAQLLRGVRHLAAGAAHLRKLG